MKWLLIYLAVATPIAVIQMIVVYLQVRETRLDQERRLVRPRRLRPGTAEEAYWQAADHIERKKQ